MSKNLQEVTPVDGLACVKTSFVYTYSVYPTHTEFVYTEYVLGHTKYEYEYVPNTYSVP